MAPSKALRKVYIDQPQRCAFIIHQAAIARPMFKWTRPTQESTSRRAFGTTISIKADDIAPMKRVNARDQSRNQTSSSGSQSRQPKSIDLSSIASNPGYKPATERSPSSTRNSAISALDSLLRMSREASVNSSQTSLYRRPGTLFGSSPSSQPASAPTTFNADFYAKGRTVRPQPFGAPGSSNALMKSLVGGKAESAERTGLYGLTSDIAQENRLVLRLKPSLGRNVKVRNDLTRAFQTLESKINSRGNAVRREEKEQKFHVRQGQAKKIERRARWRALFKSGYIAELARVRKMIKQGW